MYNGHVLREDKDDWIRKESVLYRFSLNTLSLPLTSLQYSKLPSQHARTLSHYKNHSSIKTIYTKQQTSCLQEKVY